MISKLNLKILLVSVLFGIRCIPLVYCRGPLILYRPRDITLDCVFSQKLRYDLSFGMGMSDTITLVLRTIPDMYYECEVEVSADKGQAMYTVLKFPNPVGLNCEVDPRAFHVMLKNERHPVCELLSDTDVETRYWKIVKRGRFRFQFRNNSTLRIDIDINTYEVTVTTARKLVDERNETCYNNETECYYSNQDEFYCMTNGIVCDGINNCGVDDWYDERRSECEVPIQYLDYSPILTVIIIFTCVILASIFFIQRCLPQGTHFFVFSSARQSSLIISPVFRKPSNDTDRGSVYKKRKLSIPIDFDSSDSDLDDDDDNEQQIQKMREAMLKTKEDKKESIEKPASKLRLMSMMIGRRLRSVVEEISPVKEAVKE